MKRLPAVAAAALLTLAWTGCGGGGGAAAPPGSTPIPTASPSPTPGPPVAVSVSIAIPAVVTSSASRSPRYVSPATQTVQIAVNGGAAQTFPVSGGTACTTASPPQTSCVTFQVQAPVGSDTFSVTLLDAGSHVLSSGTTTATIVQNQTNTIAVAFNGVVASLAVSLTNPAPPVGRSSTIGVTVLPLDAAKFTIIGAAGSLPSITVTDSDSTGATQLYLAGNDQTCGTTSGGPSSSVTTSPVVIGGVTQYLNVCLAYGGQTLAGATITAAIVSGPSASASLVPSSSPAAAGAWIYGQDAGSNVVLEHVDANLNVFATVAGANTGLQSSVAGLAVDGGGNVYVFMSGGTVSQPNRILVFPPTASGNVAPASSTQFATPQDANTGIAFGTLGVALDGAGGAYVAIGTASASCVIYHVPLVNGTATATPTDCSAYFHGGLGGRINGLRGDKNGNVYLAFEQTALPSVPTFQIVRYAPVAGGTLTANSDLLVPSLGFAFDKDGNVLTDTNANLSLYPGADFVAGQSTTPGPPVATYSASAPVAIDGAGNVYAKSKTAAQIGVIHGGGQSFAATQSFTPQFMAGSLP